MTPAPAPPPPSRLRIEQAKRKMRKIDRRYQLAKEALERAALHAPH